jgi:hypothetical protein
MGQPTEIATRLELICGKMNNLMLLVSCLCILSLFFLYNTSVQTRFKAHTKLVVRPLGRLHQTPLSSGSLQCDLKHLGCQRRGLQKCTGRGVQHSYTNGKWIKVRNRTDLKLLAYEYQDLCNAEHEFPCHVKEPNQCRPKAEKLMTYEWIPDSCKLDRFDSKRFAESLANKTVLYVGDSLMRQMFNSMRFLMRDQLQEASRGRLEQLITKYGGRFIFGWSRFLIDEGVFEEKGKLQVKSGWLSLLPAVDMIVFNVGHHWHKIDKQFRLYNQMVKLASLNFC